MSAINRSLLASAAASAASSGSTTSATSKTAKTAMKGVLCSPEGVSLEAYVRRAWSSLDNGLVSVAPDAFAFTFEQRVDTNANIDADITDITDITDEAEHELVAGTAPESLAEEDIEADSEADKGALPDPMTLPLPLQALISTPPENIKMHLQAGTGFSKTPSIGASALPQANKPQANTPETDAPKTDARRADTLARTPPVGLSAIPKFSSNGKPISKKLAPTAASPVAQTVQISKFDKSGKSGETDAKPAAPATEAIRDSAASSIDVPKTQTSAQERTQTSASTQTSIQTPIQTPIQTSIPATTKTQASESTQTKQLAALSVEMPHREKSKESQKSPLKIASDAVALPLPLPLMQAMQEQTPAAAPNAASASQDRGKPSPQQGQASASAPSTAGVDAVATAATGSTLTYRFDKWNGNHAVTVHAPLDADGRLRNAEQTTRNTAQNTTPSGSQSGSKNDSQGSASNSAQPRYTEKFAAQNAVPQSAKYTLSPSDDLVGRRLSEHLARPADMPDAHDKPDYPSMRLADADERQRRHQQAPQEDDEDEA
jgi:hypothetical protein